MISHTYSEETPMYNNVFLARVGIASRREADKLIDAGLVTVNGKPAMRGKMLKKGDVIAVNKELKEFSYFVYYKPRGEVTGLHNGMKGLHPIGRLDKESEGLLIYSDDHRMVSGLLEPKNNIQKTYEVWTQEKLTEEQYAALKKGVRFQGITYKKPADIVLAESRNKIIITITEGKKHELRRMFTAVGLTVTRLKRSRIVGISFPEVKSGDFKKIRGEELKALKQVLN